MRRGVLLFALAGCAPPRAAPAVVTIPSVRAAPAARPPAAAPGRAARADALRGVWREFWGDPETTDVMFHDIYRIDPDAGGAPRLRVDGEGGAIKRPAFAADELTFTQVTAFDVHYRLRLGAGGRRLEGTARSPNGVFPVRWEKIAEGPDDEVPREGEADE